VCTSVPYHESMTSSRTVLYVGNCTLRVKFTVLYRSVEAVQGVKIKTRDSEKPLAWSTTLRSTPVRLSTVSVPYRYTTIPVVVSQSQTRCTVGLASQ
jgi:hypothetical protein